MVRKRGKIALYEVIGKARVKPGEEKSAQPLHPDEIAQTATPPQPQAAPVSKLDARWPRKPKIAQVNAGRLEFSIPYPIAITVALGIVLLLLASYRFGQMSLQDKTQTPEPTPMIDTTTIRSTTPLPKPKPPATTTRTATKTTAPVRGKGSNRIVIATHTDTRQLAPIAKYFAGHGIATETRRIGGRYFLVTAEKYENPKTKGTNGFNARKRIVELGGNYKSPQGYASFGKKPFQDAYGMKFDD